VKSFYTAGMLFDVLGCFGEISEDVSYIYFNIFLTEMNLRQIFTGSRSQFSWMALKRHIVDSESPSKKQKFNSLFKYLFMLFP